MEGASAGFVACSGGRLLFESIWPLLLISNGITTVLSLLIGAVLMSLYLRKKGGTKKK